MTSRFAYHMIKLTALFITIFIIGCVTVERSDDTIVIDPWTKTAEKIKDFWAKLKGETIEEQTGGREEAIKRYNYKGLTDELIVESPLISPNSVSPGDKIRQELQFVLLAPQKEKKFNVSETVILRGSKDAVELIKRSSERAQGMHLSTLNFVIPADMEPGEYTLITTISIGEQKKTVRESFKLLEKQLYKETFPAADSTGREKIKGQEKIFYILWSEKTKTCSLWAINPDGTQKAKILHKLSSCDVSLSSDGNKIAIAGGEVPAEGHFDPQVREFRWISFINFRGEEESKFSLPKTMEVEKLILSPDGIKIVFGGKKFDSKIKAYHTYWYLIDAKTGKANLMSTHSTKEVDSGRPWWDNVEWWPDSKRFLVHQMGYGLDRLSLINQDGKEESFWDIVGGWLGSFKISPDGTKIAFTGQYSPEKFEYIGPALFVEKLDKSKINYASSKPILYTKQLWMEEEFAPWSFCWSPDGRMLAVSDEKALHVVNADGMSHRIILKGDTGRLIGWVTNFRHP